MRLLLITISAFSLMTLSAVDAFACSCAELRPCQAYGESSAVFVGTVIDSRIITITQSGYERRKRVVRLSVDSPFRGVKGSEVEVTTGMGNGDCGFQFIQAGQYLVYASEYDGKLSTSICSRTRSIARAAEDLKFIRELATAKPGATINGRILTSRRKKIGSDDKLVAHIKVTIEGQSIREIKTDNKGQFRVEGLPPGPYVVKVWAPAGLAVTGPSEQKVEVIDRGCTDVDFWIEPES